MYEKVTSNYIVGAEFDKHKVTAWFNNEAFHAPPLALNLINRAILKQSAGNEYDIELTNKPFMYLSEDEEILVQTLDNKYSLTIGIYIIFLLGVIFPTWTSIFISFNIKERVSGLKLLQMISGINKIVFWLVPYLIDLMILIVINTIIVLLFAIVDFIDSEAFSHFNEFEELARMWLVNFMFSFAVIPLIYLMSHLFDTPGTGESVSILFGILTGESFRRN